jgi:uncharacterized protein (DUF849 family)
LKDSDREEGGGLSRRALLLGASGLGITAATGRLRPAFSFEGGTKSSPGRPLVIEAAVNGSTPKSRNPNVPRSIEEIATSGLACVDAGASIVHNHNDEPNWGEPSVHSPDPYEQVWRRIWDHHPGLLMHPTTSGERSAPVEARFSHLAELHRRGALTMASADAGCLGLALDSPEGPRALPVFGNSATDVAWIFQWCRERDVPVHISIFEPGFLRLTIAHLRAGSLPRRSKIQLYFGGETALFGLPPRQSSVEVLLELLEGTDLPWMVGVLFGDVLGSGLAEFAIRRGGHVRVAALGRQLGRRPADPSEVAGVFWGV